MHIPTVNVIEWAGNTVQGLTAFPDTAAGNNEAEAHFTKLVKEYKPEIEEASIVAALEDGRFEGAPDYEVLLVHSNGQ